MMKTKLDFDLYAIHKKYLDQLLHQKLAFLRDDHLILTEKGKMMADKISSDLFAST
jgi:oxygen-independent coproporphyrinogen-3 oxidase